jgi:hypothetical protein
MHSEPEQTPVSAGTAVDVRVGKSRWRVPGVVALAVCSAVAAFAGGRATSTEPTQAAGNDIAALRSELAAFRAETAQRFEETRSEQRATRADVRDLKREVREIRETSK